MLRPGWQILVVCCGVQVDAFVVPWMQGIIGDLITFTIVVHCTQLSFLDCICGCDDIVMILFALSISNGF